MASICCTPKHLEGQRFHICWKTSFCSAQDLEEEITVVPPAPEPLPQISDSYEITDDIHPLGYGVTLPADTDEAIEQPKQSFVSVAVVKRISEKLDCAIRVAWKRRRVVSWTLWAVGTIVIVVGIVIHSIPFKILDGIVGLFLLLSGVYLFFMGVLPSDRPLILVAAFLGPVTTFGLGVFAGMSVVADFFAGCAEGMTDSECSYNRDIMGGKVVELSVALVILAMFAYHACRHRESTQLLDAEWYTVFRLMVLFAVHAIFEFVRKLIFKPEAEGSNEHKVLKNTIDLGLRIFMYGLFAAVLRTPRLRARVQGFLSRQGGTTSSGAAIAFLLGHSDSSTVYVTAQTLFRGVSCERLREDLFRESKPSRTCFSLSEPAELGEVDMFLSHSWHDPLRAKWEALQEYRHRFKALNHGREPRLWIDRFCVHPDHIAEYLTCLPVFMASCERLLMLVGPTFLSRYWCVFEAYLFVEMGHSTEEVDLRVLKSANMHASENVESVADFAIEAKKFKASECKCTVLADQLRIQTFIEIGCGIAPVFDRAVRSIVLRAFTNSAFLLSL